MAGDTLSQQDSFFAVLGEGSERLQNMRQVDPPAVEAIITLATGGLIAEGTAGGVIATATDGQPLPDDVWSIEQPAPDLAVSHEQPALSEAV